MLFYNHRYNVIWEDNVILLDLCKRSTETFRIKNKIFFSWKIKKKGEIIKLILQETF